jgi:hypothetical protein
MPQHRSRSKQIIIEERDIDDPEVDINVNNNTKARSITARRSSALKSQSKRTTATTSRTVDKQPEKLSKSKFEPSLLPPSRVEAVNTKESSLPQTNTTLTALMKDHACIVSTVSDSTSTVKCPLKSKKKKKNSVVPRHGSMWNISHLNKNWEIPADVKIALPSLARSQLHTDNNDKATNNAVSLDQKFLRATNLVVPTFKTRPSSSGLPKNTAPLSLETMKMEENALNLDEYEKEMDDSHESVTSEQRKK